MERKSPNFVSISKHRLPATAVAATPTFRTTCWLRDAEFAGTFRCTDVVACRYRTPR